MSEELGVSKQAVRKYFDKMPDELIPKKVNGKYIIDEKAQNWIKENCVTIDTSKRTKNELIDLVKKQKKEMKNKKNKIEILEFELSTLDTENQTLLDENNLLKHEIANKASKKSLDNIYSAEDINSLKDQIDVLERKIGRLNDDVEYYKDEYEKMSHVLKTKSAKLSKSKRDYIHLQQQMQKKAPKTLFEAIFRKR